MPNPSETEFVAHVAGLARRFRSLDRLQTLSPEVASSRNKTLKISTSTPNATLTFEAVIEHQFNSPQERYKDAYLVRELSKGTFEYRLVKELAGSDRGIVEGRTNSNERPKANTSLLFEG